MPAVVPTCVGEGLTEGVHCSFCGEILVNQNVVEPIGRHDPVTNIAYAPTCIEDGLTDGSHCSLCNEILIKQEIIPATGHTYSGDTCGVCGEFLQTPVLEYTLSADGTQYELTSVGTATDNDIIIPKQYKGLPVTSIAPSAFVQCSSITSISIPDSVTSVGAYAFCGCTGLTSVTFENTSGWYCTLDSTATSGTNMDVTDPSTNARNLTSNYSSDYWKRNG